jgi:hypothetical protein
VDDVEEGLVARPDQAVGEDVRVGFAAVARDGVDRLDLLRAELEQDLHRLGDDLVLADARSQQLVDPLVDGIDDRGGVGEQRLLVLGLELARLQHHALGVGGVDPGSVERFERDHVAHVDAERLVLGAALAQLVGDLGGHRVGDAGLVRHRAAHARDAGAPARLGQPRGVQLVMARSRAEIPEDRVGVAAQQREAGVLVPGPLADVGARDVADVVRIEEEQGAEVRLGERGVGALEPLASRRAKSIRCSQSTAMTAPREAIVLIGARSFPPPGGRSRAANGDEG